MQEQILEGFREIAVRFGYAPEEVYIVGEKLIMPIPLAEKALKAIEAIGKGKIS